MNKVVAGGEYSYTYSFPNPSDINTHVLISGWIKCSSSQTTPVTFSLKNQGDLKTVELSINDKWIFFAIPFQNKASPINFTCNNQNFVELKDIRLSIQDATVISCEYYLCGESGELPLYRLRFANERNGIIDCRFEPGDICEIDLLRYFLNRVRGEKSNEFYCFSNTAHPSMITSADQIVF